MLAVGGQPHPTLRARLYCSSTSDYKSPMFIPATCGFSTCFTISNPTVPPYQGQNSSPSSPFSSLLFISSSSGRSGGWGWPTIDNNVPGNARRFATIIFLLPYINFAKCCACRVRRCSPPVLLLSARPLMVCIPLEFLCSTQSILKS